VNGAISAAVLCERFVEDAAEHVSPAKYESYKYSCQKLTDALGDRDAHTIRPTDIAGFSKPLLKTLTRTTH
jgi:hypothetical protein